MVPELITVSRAQGYEFVTTSVTPSDPAVIKKYGKNSENLKRKTFARNRLSMYLKQIIFLMC